MSTFMKPVLLLTTSIFVIAGTALAGPRADTNQDGQITQAEFMTEANTRFVGTDTNSDGILTRDETKAYMELQKTVRADAHFAKLDANSDGMISKSEYDANLAEKEAMRQAKRLERGDLNKDGVVDTADRDLRKAEAKTKRKKMDGKRGFKKKKNDRIRRDANGDGQITRAEFDSATTAMFLRLDVNGDGVLTKGEGRPMQGRHNGGRR